MKKFIFLPHFIKIIRFLIKNNRKYLYFFFHFQYIFKKYIKYLNK